VCNTVGCGCELHGPHREGALVGVIVREEEYAIGAASRIHYLVRWLVDRRARENFGRLAAEDNGKDACLCYMRQHEIRVIEAVELLGALA